MIGEVVFLAPVAKISGEDEESGWVIEERRKYLAVVVGHLLVYWTYQDRHDFHFFPKCLDNERQVHLNTVFIFLIIEIQHEESLFLLQLVHDFNVDVKRTKRSVILIHVRQGTTREVFVMRGSEDEYTLYIVGASDVCISPSCCRSAEV